VRGAFTTPVRRGLAAAFCTLTAACTLFAPPAPLPANAEPPPPAINLSGFPLPYRQGYADGCASATSAERRDEARFKADGNYHMGWTDGKALCAAK
jgi:hypothetical protein